MASLTRGEDGSFYGTTFSGGLGYGVVFRFKDGTDGHLSPGDANGDGALDISDAVNILSILFVGGDKVFPCGDGSATNPASVQLIDWQPDGTVDISDAVALLSFLFLGGQAHALAFDADATGCVPIAGCSDFCAAP
jgi:hypothetical protein